MRFRSVLVAPLLTLAAPAVAFACPVCGASGLSDNSWAYGAMTAVLSGLPLGMIGGVLFWVHRRSSRRDEETLRPPVETSRDV